jgi:hypothetical protein
MKYLLTAVLVSVCATSAWAGATSSASLTGLRYELVDLDPSDGVTPAISFTGVSLVQTVIDYHYCSEHGGCSEARGDFRTPAFADISSSQPDYVKNAFASASGTGLFAGGSFGSTDSGGARTRNYDLTAYARYQGQPGRPLFQLSANTGVRITAQYTLDAAVDPWRKPPREFKGTESASAGFFFQSKFMQGGPVSRNIDAESDWLSPPDFQHETGEIAVLLRNDKDHMATIWGKFGVTASSVLPSIPEPSTYALMLAGLGLLGFVARRRTQP